MFGSLYEILDGIDYYVSSREERLAVRNVKMLQLFSIILGMIGTTFLIVRYAQIPGTLPEPCFLFLYAFLLVVYIEYRFLRQKKELSFKVTRFAVILHYVVFVAIFSLIEIQVINVPEHLIVLPIILILLPAVYTDYFSVVAFSEVLMIIEYFVIYFLYTGHSASWMQVFAGITFVFLSLCVELVYASNQASSASEEKILKDKSSTDLLTGLKNKVSFEEESRKALSARISGAFYILLILDFDNFKHVNDKYGHQTGDEALKGFAALLVREFRTKDIIGRVGGDEFMVLVRDLPPNGIELIENRCKNILHELKIMKINDARGFSCSIGMIADRMGLSFDAMYHLADDALYEAKARGKARYASWKSGEAVKTKTNLVYILTKDVNKREKIIKELDENENQILFSDSTTEALNEISLYQKHINTLYLDMGIGDITADELEDYMASRSVFSKIEVKKI